MLVTPVIAAFNDRGVKYVVVELRLGDDRRDDVVERLHGVAERSRKGYPQR